MRWQGRRSSSNVEDRRGMGGGGKGIVGGGLGLIILIIYTLLGGNPGDVMNNNPVTSQQEAPYEQTSEEQQLSEFVSVVLADTEDVWNQVFADMNSDYKEPVLVLYNQSVQSACGNAGSSTGPFYCPADQKLYIDLSFYDDLNKKFNAPGDFAMAYVVAHEVGHHVQNLLGISDQVQALRGKISEKEYNQYSVKLELQADFFAGVWAHYAQNKNLLEQGDFDEAITAAGAVGDDRIQKKSQGYIVPDSFTHGSSEQRIYWFKKGFESGDINDGDTFNSDI